MYKYEDLVDQRFGGLEKYLGFKLEGNGTVPPEMQRVARTKGYDNWRDWFVATDIHFLCPLLRPFLERYYPDADWELNISPTIPAKYASKYVERMVNDRRTSMGICVIGRESRSEASMQPISAGGIGLRDETSRLLRMTND